MSNDKTLATVKHGGCVQLPSSERARFEAWAEGNNYEMEWTGLRYVEEATHDAWLAWQAALSAQPKYFTDAYELGLRDGKSLSAQPAPGGQGDEIKVSRSLLDRVHESLGNFTMDHGWSQSDMDVADDLAAALAARQPVRIYGGCAQPEGELVTDAMVDAACKVMHHGYEHESRKAYREACQKDARQALQAALAARQPVGEPVAWMTHHDEPMLYPTFAEAAAYCDDDEPPIPLYAAPFAQAVDLGLQLDRYDAGLLGDGGGGDVGWWQDYIRTELDRAHEFYQDQADSQAVGK